MTTTSRAVCANRISTIFWVGFGLFGILEALDWLLDRVLTSLKLKKSFMAWVWERMKTRSRTSRHV